jgi:hypothetical protein
MSVPAQIKRALCNKKNEVDSLLPMLVAVVVTTTSLIIAPIFSHANEVFSVSPPPSPHVILSSTYPDIETHKRFKVWKVKYVRTYNADHAKRKLIWIENHSMISHHKL